MNNIPFFEILVVLFVLWPLVERFLNKNKTKPVNPDESEFDGNFYEEPSNSAQGTTDRKKPDWDEALRELETIFTGGTRPPVPSQGTKQNPAPGNVAASRRQDAPAHQSFSQMRATKKADDEFRDLSNALIASKNPIYTSLDESPDVHSDTPAVKFSVFEDIRSQQRLREFFVMKEVLDKPVSLRNKRKYH